MFVLRGLLNAARTLSYYARLQEVTANNLANASTTGFKADRLTARTVGQVPHPIPVEATDFSQGTLRGTGRSLDLALDGPGFFVVETPRGERLVRGGSFRLDGGGRLADADGNPLLGRNGSLALQGPDIEIRSDGTVLDGGHEVGRLRVVVPDAEAALMKEVGGRFRVEPEGTLRDRDETLVRQGQLEDANLDALTTMVSLVEIQRAYAANVTTMRTMDGVLGSLTNDVGRL
jgi:flagellar basal body rod protein FlgG